VKKKWIYRSIGLLILAVIICKMDTRKYVDLLAGINYFYFLYASLLVLSIYFIKAYRWKLLISSQKIDYSYKNTFLAFTSSNFIAFITPGRLGEFAKVLYLKNDTGVPLSKSLPSVITDRLFDVYCLLFFGIFGIFYFNIGINIWFIIALTIILITPFFVFSQKLYDIFFTLLSKLPLISGYISKKAGGIENMKKEFQLLININLLYAFIISMISYLVLFYAADLLAQSVNLSLRFTDVILVNAVANVLSFLPISVSGLGTREAVFIYFLSKFGYSIEQALIYSTLFFFCFFIIGGLYGYACYMIKPVSIKNLKKEIS
jgi:glycosyltransferase 2 family protein